MDNYLLNVVQSQSNGIPIGIYSVCSSNRYVLEASMLQAKQDESFLLIEPTVNQVNQYGGYTGRTPANFVDFISQIAKEVGFPTDKLILGGDHLGPNPWKSETSAKAMGKSKELVRAYVEAGFTKIHLDTSMPCADDDVEPGVPMGDEVVADRAAELCKIAEETYQNSSNNSVKPVYVIGTEVPIPGGAEGSIHNVKVTSVESAANTIDVTKNAFLKRGLDDAWNRVIAQVVQPGVEFGNNDIVEYDSRKASDLSRFIQSCDSMIFEAHSTDYQPPNSLRKLVADGFAILKVGPWLTFSFREAIFSLSLIEEELLSSKKAIELSDFQNILDRTMIANPQSWENHYDGDAVKLKYLRKYSYSDRSRYYWQNSSVEKAVNKLFQNLDKYDIPLPLLSQFLPDQYIAIKQHELENTARDIVLHKIRATISLYSQATQQAV